VNGGGKTKQRESQKATKPPIMHTYRSGSEKERERWGIYVLKQKKRRRKKRGSVKRKAHGNPEQDRKRYR
jgi:hypothetical protein